MNRILLRVCLNINGDRKISDLWFSTAYLFLRHPIQVKNCIYFKGLVGNIGFSNRDIRNPTDNNGQKLVVLYADFAVML